MLIYMNKRNVPKPQGGGVGRVWASIAARMAQAGRRATYHARVYEGPPSYNTESPGTNEGHTDGGGGTATEEGWGYISAFQPVFVYFEPQNFFKACLIRCRMVRNHKIIQ